jgi:hypothetical protein
MLTADTITDDHIRGLQRAFAAAGNRTMARFCDRALSHHMREARARCAQILNGGIPA